MLLVIVTAYYQRTNVQKKRNEEIFLKETK